ncbi:NADPH-dependent F420 reductase [Streptomyces triticiradicis]|uniref:NADP oxidoreductase n=1 Tax=Streptomyces triticiradicis TaxID=2651189 RepID=A0A7J5DMX6_9ACTN|nr:NAD(P)-binding domain-containing protein [Streptomyces triticiradicis]KAB1990102.1 NADP oxidoreductase [Streptomyces triticiradicis]
MATLGLIGSGNIGGTLARLAVDAGLDVVLSNSRGPETLGDLVSDLGPRARAATPAEAGAAGDWVVVTVPLKAFDQIPVAPLSGKTVIDTGNYYPQRDGEIPALKDGSTTESQLLQGHLPDAHVVKGFNNIFFRHLGALARPKGAPDRTTLPIAGDDPTAVAHAAELLDLLGFDALAYGGLADSWRSQPGTPVYGLPYAGDAADFMNAEATPAGADVVRARLEAATR